MDVRPIIDQNTWTSFVLAHAPRSGAFLQSWTWGEFQIAAGHAVERLGLFDGDALRGVAQLIASPLPLGQRYFSCLRGPVLASGTLEAFTDQVRGRGMFLRIEPLSDPARTDLVSIKAVSPADTLILSLAPTEEHLLAAMHPKTRYNIKLAERKGVKVETWSVERFAEVWPLFTETAGRDGFRLHARAHYETLLKTLAANETKAFLAVATHENKPLAANLMIDFGDTRTYLHGASGGDRTVMAPFALHWTLIKQAKATGLAHYDWWGIAGSDDANDPWAGITRFKKGFGGEEVRYPGTFDLVLEPTRYRLYTGARDLMRQLRHRHS